MREEAALFGKTRSLVGVITFPDTSCQEASDSSTAVILLNSGLLHRVGPNRLYVKAARRLASAGFVVFRFDFSGIGDSAVRVDNLPFDKSGISETQEAMDFLDATRGISKFILIGICSGAYVALRVACCDSRVVGVIPIEGYARPTMRYYWRHFTDATSWWRIISCKKDPRDTMRMAWRLVRALVTKLRRSESRLRSEQPGVDLATDVLVSTDRCTRVLLLYAKGSPAYYTYVTQKGKLSASIDTGRLQIEVIDRANHTFTPLSVQENLLRVIQHWVKTSRSAELTHIV